MYDTSKMPSLAIATVVYNTYGILDDFFSSLDASISAARISCKDGDSLNVTVYLADLSDSPQDYAYPPYVQVIPAENRGYAHGVNMATVQAMRDGQQQFMVINSDVIFSKDCVSNALARLTDHPKTILGGKIWYAAGYEYHTDRYSDDQRGTVLWYAGGKIDWNHVTTAHCGVDEVDGPEWNTPGKTEFVTGCLMLYDRQVIDTVGLWDEAYFLYFEDADFCVRAAQAGVALRYEPSIGIWHKNAQSTDGAGSDLHMRYQRRNRLRFGLKYAPWRTKLHLVKDAVLGRL